MEKEKTVLIIEDDRALVKALEYGLKDKGLEVKAYFYGDGAYEKVLEIKPDLILLDLVLPGVHGFEILKAIKSGEITKDIPVIVATNLGEDSDKKRSMELGADDFIVKAQIDLEKIFEKIKKILF